MISDLDSAVSNLVAFATQQQLTSSALQEAVQKLVDIAEPLQRVRFDTFTWCAYFLIRLPTSREFGSEDEVSESRSASHEPPTSVFRAKLLEE